MSESQRSLLGVLTTIGLYLLLVHAVDVAPLPSLLIAVVAGVIVFVATAPRRAVTPAAAPDDGHTSG